MSAAVSRAVFAALQQLDIQVVVYSESAALRRRVAASLDAQPSSDAAAKMVITDGRICDEAFYSDVAKLAAISDALLVISDRFLFTEQPVTPQRHTLAQQLRDRCGDSKAVLALLAVVDSGVVTSIDLVDALVVSAADNDTFNGRVYRLLSALRYKLPPRRLHLDGPTAIEVHAVRSAEEFQACLELRHAVYGLLGYFEDGRQGDGTPLELDYYDQSALHLIAVSSGSGRSRVAGTARLVLASGVGFIRRRSTTLCDQITAAFPVLRERLQNGPGASALPLFAAFNYGEISPDRNATIGQFCELSRVVVAEEFRGLDVSRVLVRACIAEALRLQHRYIVLECIPQHSVMYAKSGFTPIHAAKYRRAWSINQLAVVMRLDLMDDPTNSAVQIAKNDLEMVAARRQPGARPGLCLCRRSPCWRAGNYDEKGGPQCPLKTTFAL